LHSVKLHPNDRVTAVILAGGKSSRMGTDKALLPWQGMPMLQRVYVVAQCCCIRVEILTPWPDRYRELLPDAIFQVEQKSGFGPLVALAQSLDQVESPWLLLLACDLPQLDATILQDWIKELPTTEPAWAYVPYRTDRWEPLCGFYHVNALPHLQTFIADGGRSFQRWLNQIPAVPLGVDDAIAAMLWNCNTPTDWREGHHGTDVFPV
jgi:molybdopterin-guanine dinucleotide biosynthesis protein A